MEITQNKIIVFLEKADCGRDAARDACTARCIGHVMGRKVPIVQVEIVGPVLAERVEADVSVIRPRQLAF